MFGRMRPVTLVNARVVTDAGEAESLRFASTIEGIGVRPHAADAVVDLDGAMVLPGLINCHDHLELNHYGPLKRRDRYDNAAAWIDDLRPVVREDPIVRRNSAFKLADRLFIGGLKNLLAGATTVAHHNPVYRHLKQAFPVRVLSDFGWAHSFQLQEQPVGANGEPGGRVDQRYRSTPAGFPFIVHAAEGVDQAAAAEIERLERLGCLRENTVLVHGVAITSSTWPRMRISGTSLIWCPASNRYLFGATAPVRELLDAAPDAWMHVCLGTDSRLTGSRDLLDEMRLATQASSVTAREVMRMVTTAAARVLRLAHRGTIAIGRPADFIVIPSVRTDPADTLLATSRRDIRVVVIGGRPRIGDSRACAIFKARGVEPASLTVDESPRLVDARIARAIERCPIAENGVSAHSSRRVVM